MPVGRIRHKVKKPAGYWMHDCAIKKISYTRVDQFSVVVDVIIIADLEVTGNDSSEFVKQWYRVRIFTCFKESEFKQNETISVYDPKENYNGMPLSDYLVPYLSAKNMEQEVINLLEIYYKEAIDNSIKPDMYLLAERMGYTIKYVNLSPDGTGDKGKTVFCDTEMVLYDENGNGYVEYLKAKTILIDKKANQINGFDTTEETIAHECTHIYEHYPFFGLQKMYAEELGLLGLDINKLMYDNRSSEPVQWVERQARAMMLRLMMPITSVANKYEQSYRMNAKKYHDKYRVLEETIKDVADFFNVTKSAAKRRVGAIGVKQVYGIMNWVNGKPIPPYNVPDSYDPRSTYNIDLVSLTEEYKRNPIMKRLLDSGRFIYAEGHLCLYDKRYITFENGEAKLTTYARNHIDECCHLFLYKKRQKVYGYKFGSLSNSSDETGCTALVLGTATDSDLMRFHAEAKRVIALNNL